MAEQLFAPQQRDAALEAERLRAENARLREQLTARRIGALAEARVAPAPAEGSLGPSALLRHARCAAQLSLSYARGSVAAKPVGAAMCGADAPERRATLSVTVGPRPASPAEKEKEDAEADRPERPCATGRCTAVRYDWTAGAASLPAELASLMRRAGLPLPAARAGFGAAVGLAYAEWRATAPPALSSSPA